MFADTCPTIRKSLYAIVGMTQIGRDKLNASTGSAFMVSAGVLVTAAHLIHCRQKAGRPRHDVLYAFHAREAAPMSSEPSTIVAEDLVRDIAILRVATTRSVPSVNLELDQVPIGTLCGFLGFPFSKMLAIDKPELVVRFQAAHVSAFTTITDQNGRTLPFYETDRYMYPGSSGCPSFLMNGKVFGMHTNSAIDPSQGPTANSEGESRFALSLSVPAKDIFTFLKEHKIELQS